MNGQKFEVLNADELARLNEARAWVKGHFQEDAEEAYASVPGKLGVLDAILANKWVSAQQTAELEALGAALGDALVQELKLEWIAVEDEHGRSPAVNWPGTRVTAFPLTMIRKRIERGDEVDVYDLFGGTCSVLSEHAAKPDFQL